MVRNLGSCRFLFRTFIQLVSPNLFNATFSTNSKIIYIYIFIYFSEFVNPLYFNTHTYGSAVTCPACNSIFLAIHHTYIYNQNSIFFLDFQMSYCIKRMVLTFTCLICKQEHFLCNFFKIKYPLFFRR